MQSRKTSAFSGLVVIINFWILTLKLSSSYTTSLASSVTAYKYEHGRRYHAYQEGSMCTVNTGFWHLLMPIEGYILPNDEVWQVSGLYGDIY